MRLLRWVLILLLLPSALLAGRVALVIGNSNYSAVAPLDNPYNDAAAVAAALERQGFQVLRGTDLGRIGMRDALRRFRDLADNAEIALIYYAGHGIEIGGTNYLVPVDARLEDERDAALEMVDLDLVLRQISGASQMRMVVLDACRNNPFVARMQRENGSRAIRQGLGDIRTSKGDTLIAYAAAAGAITPDGPVGSNSPFTAAFLAALDGPPADVRRMLGRVRDRMRRSVPGAAPFVYSSLGGGEYVINPNSPGGRAQPQDPAPLDTPSIAEDFVTTDRDGTLADWDAFLIRHEGQSDHPLYAFALEKREALLQAARQAAAAPDPARLAASDPASRMTPMRPAADPPPAATGLAPTETSPTDLATAEPTPAVPEPPSRDALARDIQTALKDSGCYRGRIDGVLGRNSKRALGRFADTAGIGFDLATLGSPDGLAAILRSLRAHPGTTCPDPKPAGTAPGTVTARPKAAQPAPAQPAPAAKSEPRTAEPKDCPVRGSLNNQPGCI